MRKLLPIGVALLALTLPSIAQSLPGCGYVSACSELQPLDASGIVNRQMASANENYSLFTGYVWRQTAAQSAPRANVASFTSPVEKAATAEAFEAFIEKHRGKLVHLNTKFDVSFSRIGDNYEGETDFFAATEVCAESTSTLECDGAHYMLSGSDYTLRYYGDHNILIGYFLVNEDVQMHQGRYYRLKAIPADRVLLGR